MSGATGFRVPTEVVTGIGSLERLPELLERNGAHRVAVVADAALADIGVLDLVLSYAPGLDPATVCTFPPDPSVAVVEEAALGARRSGAAAVLAIGGGSSLGAGKAIAIRITNDEPIATYEGAGRVPVLPAPTIAVPTTAGSGSEVSNALVLHEVGRSTDLVVRGPGCEPRAAILDGRLLRGLPYGPMLYSGLDALTHAMEALWTNGSSFFSEALGVRAAERMLDLLPVALAGVATGANASGTNDAVLQELLEASSSANMACGNSGLGLVHALSSAPDVRLPHGLQNGVLLPHVSEFNLASMPMHARRLVPRIAELYRLIGFEASFKAATGDRIAVDSMIAATRGHPFLGNNRRSPSDAELHRLLIEAGASDATTTSRAGDQ